LGWVLISPIIRLRKEKSQKEALRELMNNGLAKMAPPIKRVEFSSHYSPLRQPVISGRAFIPERRDPASLPKDEKYVLVTKEAGPNNLVYLSNAIAVVSEVGGITTHLTITCRELGIPFIRLNNAADVLKDGEWMELAFRPQGQGTGSPVGWSKVYQIMGDSVTTLQDGELEKSLGIVRQLPALIGKDYVLTARYERSVDRISVYVSKASLDEFSADLRDSLDALYAKLADYDRMPHKSRWSVSLLAMLAVEHCLFPWLVELAGDMDLALSLIRSGRALYLELDGTSNLSLMRCGVPGGRMETPRALKDMFEASKCLERQETDAALRRTKDPDKAEKLAKAIRLLVYAYEDKDRPT
jgi:phosphohistidine swiveling domain-containing protein